MTENAVTIALIASEVSRLFAESKIRLISRTRYESWPADTMAFEDEYSVIVFWPFKSIQEMTAEWVSAQDHIVRLVGDNLLTNDPKTWDGYLVLASTGHIPDHLASEISTIRSDTRRIRKIVISAEDIPTIVSDPLDLSPNLRRSLAPVLDLILDSESGRTDPLKSLEERLDIPKNELQYLSALLAAHELGKPLLEELHAQLVAQTEG